MASDVVLTAVRQGDLESIKLLLSNGKLTTATRDPLGATCVHMAARNGNLEILKYLVETAKFPVNLPAENGALATHDAAALGHRGCLEYLLDKGCPIIACDCNGVNLMHLTARFGNLQLLTWLVEQREMDISTRDIKGATALHYAAAEGNLQCLIYLIQNTPHLVNDRAANGTTPTYLAAQNGHVGCLKYLIDKSGGDSCLGALDGMQPVHAAAQTGQLDCLVWLIQEQGVSSEVKDDDGATPLHFAAGRGHTQTVRWLLANDTKICKDNLGGTPLHDASEHGQYECVRILIQYGCDPREHDDDGFTPAELAKDCGHQKLAKYLQKEVSKAKKKKKEAAKSSTVMTSDYSSPTNTGTSFSSVVSDLDSTSSVFTDDEASSILNELSSTGRVTDSPTFAPEPLYMRLFEKLTEEEALTDFDTTYSHKLSTTDTSASEASTLEKKKRTPHYEIVHPHEYSAETISKMKQAGHLIPGKKEDRGLRFNSKVEEVPSLANKTTVPQINTPSAKKSPGSPPSFTKVPSPSAISVVPENNNTSPYQNQGSARNLHLPLEPPTFTAPPPPDDPPPPLPIKTSPLHRRPQSHPFSPPAAPVPPPPPPPPLAPPLPPKNEEKPKSLASPGNPSPSSSRPLTPSDLASIKLKPVVKGSSPMQSPNRQKGSPLQAQDYVNADFLAEIRAGGTLRKAKTNKSQLGKGSPTGSSSSTPSVASAASSSSNSPTRSVAETPKTPDTPSMADKDIPEWKRQFLAKKAAEKTKREEEERKQNEADEKKYSDMPPWKAELFRRKDALAKAEAEAKAKAAAPPPAPKPSPVRSSLAARSPNGGNLKPWELELLQARQGKQ